MRKIKQELPEGWTEKTVRDLIAYYDNQSEEEAVAEIESAPEVDPPEFWGGTWICVPKKLVGAVNRMIKDFAKKKRAVPARPPRNGQAKPSAKRNIKKYKRAKV